MAKTVVGLFPSVVDAQNVKHELVTNGYSADSVQVVAQATSTSTAGSVQASDGSEGTGILGSIKKLFSSFTEENDADHEYYSNGLERGGAILAVTGPDDQATYIQSILEQYGATQVNERSAGAPIGTISQGQAKAANTTGQVAIPVVEEELLVGKRQVSRGGVRVYSNIVETPVEENIQLREEHVRVQRTPVDRPASASDFETFKEGTIELTESAEEAVVSKQARVVEEVMIGKTASEHTETVKDTVRHTAVEVENLPADKAKRTGAGQ